MKHLLPALVLVVLITGWARADYLEVRRSATVKRQPTGNAEILVRPEVGARLLLLKDGEQTDGYYCVAVPSGGNSSTQEGWIYRTLVRRFAGNPPDSDGPATHPTALSAEDAALLEATQVTWPPRNDNSPEPHTVFGVPVYEHNNPNHNLVRDYSGFTVYWDDEVLGPRWTAIKLTSEMVDAHPEVKRKSGFTRDDAIVEAGLRATVHKDYNNPPGTRKWARGHIVQIDDARGWGELSGHESFFTSNIVPQLQAMNGKGWLSLEKRCSEFARDYEIAWIYCGPIYSSNPEPFAANRKVPAPIAFYKIVVSPGDNNSVDVMAFRMPHEEIESSVDLSTFLVSVDSIEEATHIDFLKDLPDSVENIIESVVWDMWPDLPNPPPSHD